jgi:site-specific recombinase XerD
MQEVRRLAPSTVARRASVVACFYRTCLIDGILEHSPAAHLRRPRAPVDSPTLGLSHLQFEAILTAARTSTNPSDFALVAMLGLRIFEATAADSSVMRSTSTNMSSAEIPSSSFPACWAAAMAFTLSR